jgi:RimJ/RimL family protein N-acetyltransferase
MQLISPDSPERVRLIAGWLTRKENSQWLDFGDGRQLVSPEWLTIAMQRRTYVFRLFTSDADDRPIGVVALGNINPHFKTANIWVVLGDRAYERQGYATRATAAMLTLGFRELGLRAIHTWIVEHNPSIYVAERVRFRPMGRQRQCHYIDGRAYDRLWFDLLASEHEDLQAELRRHSA